MSKKNSCTLALKLGINHCCLQHDMDYVNPKLARKEADRRFRDCVLKHGEIRNKKISYWFVAWTYYIAVRSFGWAFRSK